MPAVSKAQRTAMAIAEHHPEQAKGAAKEMAKSMSKSQLHDFATTPEKGLPEHKKKHEKQASLNSRAYFEGYLAKQARDYETNPVASLDALKPENMSTKDLQLIANASAEARRGLAGSNLAVPTIGAGLAGAAVGAPLGAAVGALSSPKGSRGRGAGMGAAYGAGIAGVGTAGLSYLLMALARNVGTEVASGTEKTSLGELQRRGAGLKD